MRFRTTLVPLLFLMLLVGCAPKSYTTPEARAAYTADQVVVRLGELQTATIDAFHADKVTLADARLVVTWVSGDSSTTPPTLGAVDVLRTAPAGWKATLLASWQTVRSRLLVYTALASWVPIVDSLLQGVG